MATSEAEMKAEVRMRAAQIRVSKVVIFKWQSLDRSVGDYHLIDTRKASSPWVISTHGLLVFLQIKVILRLLRQSFRRLIGSKRSLFQILPQSADSECEYGLAYSLRVRTESPLWCALGSSL